MELNRSRALAFDSPLLIVVLILLVLGVLMVYSASSFKAQERFQDNRHYLLKHIYKTTLGVVLLFVAMFSSYRKWLRWSWPLLVIAFVMLIYLVVSPNVEIVRGTKRWLTFGGFQFQPSDFARLALILVLASILGNDNSKMKNHRYSVLFFLLMIGFVVIPVLLQPDFGTAAITILVAFILLFLGGQKVHQLLLATVSFVPLLILYLLKSDYKMSRIHEFIASVKGENLTWQTKQSLIALGNGGIFGLGPGESKQKFHFLPDPFTDFIYAIVGEELGVLGTVGILVLFLILIWRGFHIAHTARDPRAVLLASGVAVNIAVYAFTNAGVVLNLLPTTGIPMPFISYGGSALIVNMIGIGLLLNISADNHNRQRVQPMESPVIRRANFAGRHGKRR